MGNDNLIPKSWIKTPLTVISLTSSGGTPSRNNKSYYSGAIPWVKSGELKYNVITKTEENISPEAIVNSSAKLLPKGTLLIALYGATVGRLAFLGIDAATNQAVAAIMCFAEMPSKYLYYYLLNRKEELLNKRIGGAQPNISQTILNELEIPLPPLNEQHRIVSKIEELFSELDHGVANLKKAQSQLKVYRQALLKQAFEGKLTEQWRKENNPEPADKLLERIQAERQTRYAQELKDWKAAVKAWEEEGKIGRKPGKPRGQQSFPKLNQEYYDLFPKLPLKWNWEKLGNVCLKIMDGTHFSPKNYVKGDFMYITAKNIKEGKIDLDDVTYVSKEDHKIIYSKCDVQKGDVLYIKDGATTGRASVNNIDSEFSLLSSVAVFRVFDSSMLSKYLEYFLNAETTKKRMLGNIAGVAITRLTLSKLNDSIVAICSLEEQKAIVSVLDEIFSVIDNLEKTIEAALQKSEALRQSILKQAFEGNLVPQDPNDEPASELLKRIQAEKKRHLEAQQQQKKRKATKTAKPA